MKTIQPQTKKGFLASLESFSNGVLYSQYLHKHFADRAAAIAFYESEKASWRLVRFSEKGDVLYVAPLSCAKTSDFIFGQVLTELQIEKMSLRGVYVAKSSKNISSARKSYAQEKAQRAFDADVYTRRTE